MKRRAPIALLLAIATALGCKEPPHAVPTPALEADVSNPEPDDSIGALSARFGEDVFEVSGRRAGKEVFDANKNHLTIRFDNLGLDYEAIAAKLGAERVDRRIPRDVSTLCGPQQGGHFKLGGVIYGIYVSGFGDCTTIRLFAPTAKSIKFFVGSSFVRLMEECNSRIVKACRTLEHVRLKFDPMPKRVSFGEDLELEDGWFGGQKSPYNPFRTSRAGYSPDGEAECATTLPDYSPPVECGLEGVAFDPEDPCIKARGDCREFGRCLNVDGKCTAVSEAHCTESRACRSDGKCVLRDGDCVAP